MWTVGGTEIDQITLYTANNISVYYQAFHNRFTLKNVSIHLENYCYQWGDGTGLSSLASQQPCKVGQSYHSHITDESWEIIVHLSLLECDNEIEFELWTAWLKICTSKHCNIPPPNWCLKCFNLNHGSGLYTAQFYIVWKKNLTCNSERGKWLAGKGLSNPFLPALLPLLNGTSCFSFFFYLYRTSCNM